MLVVVSIELPLVKMVLAFMLLWLGGSSSVLEVFYIEFTPVKMEPFKLVWFEGSGSVLKVYPTSFTLVKI